MLFAPKQIGRSSLSPDHLKADKSACTKVGPCGLGREAMYLNSFFIDRYYYVKYIDVARVFKRVAMSRGGFSGKGVFGSIPYLVVQLKNGSERACNFKYEDDVDRFLAEISRSHPEIPVLSREGEKKLAEARAKEEARYVKNLTPEAEASIAELLRAKEILSEDSGKSARLSYSAKQKRTIDLINPTPYFSIKAIPPTLFCSALPSCSLPCRPGSCRPGRTTDVRRRENGTKHFMICRDLYQSIREFRYLRSTLIPPRSIG